MSIIQKLVDKFRSKPPIIETQWGNVTEKYRSQAEINLSLDPEKRRLVLEVITRECGGDEAKGLREARRRFPRGGF